MGYPGYPGYQQAMPPPQRPSPWPWILGVLVVVAALGVGVIAAGIIVVQRDRNSTTAAPNPTAATIAASAPVTVPGGPAPAPGPEPAPVPADPRAGALDSLRAQAAADQPFVSSGIANRWVPQLSAKQPGLVAPDVDGQMVNWTSAEILAQHQRIRAQYPGARLVWSDDWATFDLQGWWITLAGTTYSDPDSANAWCDARAIPVDECFAKLVSNSRGSAGTTQYR
ncbi:hypothetical protein ACFWUP_11815 [Nocardia sp. NPDC058658]|uniref:hypothetical protein n=1 Tax=Nocardia sp. NPDC058658 TaxID=3346580 RepID=UPI00365F6BA9